jgi:tetratricopeptide (TPR) repeat protein
LHLYFILKFKYISHSVCYGWRMSLLKNKKLVYSGVIILILLAAEIVLRASNFQHAYQFFVKTDGRYTINRSYRYIQDSDLPLLIAPNFSVTKDSMTFRIFCLGDAATQGFPYPHHAAYPALLKQLLDSAQTEKKCEVINCGLPGFDSQALLDISRDVIDCYQPDLIIVLASPAGDTSNLFKTIPYINVKDAPLALLAYLQIQYRKIKYFIENHKEDVYRVDTVIKNMEQLMSTAKEARIPMLICPDGSHYLPTPLNTLYNMPPNGPLTDSLMIAAGKNNLPFINIADSTLQVTNVNNQELLPVNHGILAKAIIDNLIENNLITSDQSTGSLTCSPHVTNLDHLVAHLLIERLYLLHPNHDYADSIVFDTTAISRLAQEYVNKNEKNLGQVHITLGDQYKKKKRFDQALQEYQAAMAYEPTADAYEGLGSIYIEKARRASKRRDEKMYVDRYFQQSLAYTNAGLLLYSDNINLTFNLGLLYFIRNDKLDTALDYFNRVLAQNPNSINTMKYIAQVYLRLKEYAKAKAFLLKALQNHSKEAQFHAALSMVYLAENDIERAEESIKQAFSLKPTTQMKYLLYQVQSLRLKKEKRR